MRLNLHYESINLLYIKQISSLKPIHYSFTHKKLLFRNVSRAEALVAL